MVEAFAHSGILAAATAVWEDLQLHNILPVLMGKAASDPTLAPFGESSCSGSNKSFAADSVRSTEQVARAGGAGCDAGG